MSDAEKVLAELQREVEGNRVGIELWLDHDLWEIEKGRGTSFPDWLRAVLKEP